MALLGIFSGFDWVFELIVNAIAIPMSIIWTTYWYWRFPLIIAISIEQSAKPMPREQLSLLCQLTLPHSNVTLTFFIVCYGSAVCQYNKLSILYFSLISSWLCCFMAQMNPLMGPKLHQGTILMIAREWGNYPSDMDSYKPLNVTEHHGWSLTHSASISMISEEVPSII